jgi:hypothetical protein
MKKNKFFDESHVTEKCIISALIFLAKEYQLKRVPTDFLISQLVQISNDLKVIFESRGEK